jgi:hypothetical protein
MPRLTRSNPSYRKHKASGQAVVTINGRDVYLGPYGSRVSRDGYDRVIGEWLTNGRRPAPDAQTGDLTVLRSPWSADDWSRTPPASAAARWFNARIATSC